MAKTENDADYVDVDTLIDRAVTEAVESVQEFTRLVGEVDGFDTAFTEAATALYDSFGKMHPDDQPYHHRLAGAAVGFQFGMLMARRLAAVCGGVR